jgi:UDP-N-acetylglucosamine diphosphorylase/glucosamine-1-phosphate N-acetyltransferase
MQLCFFEDHLYSNFHPLTLSRPVDDLRLGIHTIAEKWRNALDNDGWQRLTRPELQAVFSEGNPGNGSDAPGCWINSRYLPSSTLVDEVKNLNEGTCIKSGETVVAARVDKATAQKWFQNGQPDFSSLLVLESGRLSCITHLWDLFLMNAAEIMADLVRIEKPRPGNGSISPHAILENKEQIHISEDVNIEAGAILMAGDGPIYLGKGASVKAGAIIRGSTAVCEGATVKMGAKVYPGTTIGPVCKVGGEVNNSIFHSYSNKGHDGFLGNSLIGQWCNIGADTNTSNLKNNYSTIRITDWESCEEIETGQQFLGTVMGDHTKTAINTQLNTGTMCGLSCNIFSADFPPKFIPSFSWVGTNVIQSYKIDKAFEAMEAMMIRRKVELTGDYKDLMRSIAESGNSQS